MEERFSPTSLEEIKKKLEIAREDDTPHAVYGGDSDKIAVIGDANKTEVKHVDIDMSFRFTKDELDESGVEIPECAKVVGKYVIIKTIYKDLTISPRKDAVLIDSLMGVYPIMAQIDKIKDEYEKIIQEVEEKYGYKFIISDDDEKVSTNATDKKTNDEMVQVYKAYRKEQNESLLHAYANAPEEAIDSLYHFVALFLGLDSFYEDRMMSYSVYLCLFKIIGAFPELFNEAETVFIG